MLVRLGMKESDGGAFSSDELFETFDACRSGLGVLAVCLWLPALAWRSGWYDMTKK